MLGPKSLAAILVALPATMLLTAKASLGEPTANACRITPGVAAPRGMHWYYRIERTDSRHCWYLRAEAEHVHVRKFAGEGSSPGHVQTDPPIAPAPDAAAMALPQPAVAQTSNGESPVSASRAQPATDFAARWVELPKALDLDAGTVAPPSNGYVEEATNAPEQTVLPSLIVHSRADESQQGSADRTGFGTNLLAGVLGTVLLLLCAEALKLGGMLHREVKRRGHAGADVSRAASSTRRARLWPTGTRQAARATDASSQIQLRPADLMSVLRQAGSRPHTPRSFAPSGDRSTLSTPNRRTSQGTRSTRRARFGRTKSRRHYALA